MARRGRPALPRCVRCLHRDDQHVVRDGLRVCMLCDVGSEGGACATNVLEAARANFFS